MCLHATALSLTSKNYDVGPVKGCFGCLKRAVDPLFSKQLVVYLGLLLQEIQ